MNMLNSGGGGSFGSLASAAQQIKQAQSVLSSSDLSRLSPQMQQYLDQVRNVSASQQALGQQAYATASQRVNLLQTLTNQISSAIDPKAVWDLQARIQSEQLQLQNDQSRLQSVTQLTQAQSVATKQWLTNYVRKPAVQAISVARYLGRQQLTTERKMSFLRALIVGTALAALAACTPKPPQISFLDRVLTVEEFTAQPDVRDKVIAECSSDPVI
ncbi:hypothetical protein MRX60_12910 (plasmid) [Xylella fastidiosa subsp. pauca]|nr:type IV secretion system protein [Xylella fastidiosa]MDG5826931.1 hypothetical protein [Xylella fastidiosa subsp. pauca]